MQTRVITRLYQHVAHFPLSFILFPSCPKFNNTQSSFKHRTKQIITLANSTKRSLSYPLYFSYKLIVLSAIKVSSSHLLGAAHSSSKGLCCPWWFLPPHHPISYKSPCCSRIEPRRLAPSCLSLLQGNRVTRPSRRRSVAHLLGRLWLFQLYGEFRPQNGVVLPPLVLCDENYVHRLASTPCFPRTSSHLFVRCFKLSFRVCTACPHEKHAPPVSFFDQVTRCRTLAHISPFSYRVHKLPILMFSNRSSQMFLPNTVPSPPQQVPALQMPPTSERT